MDKIISLQTFERILERLDGKRKIIIKRQYNTNKDYRSDLVTKKKRIMEIDKEQEIFLQNACKTSSEIVQ